MKQTAASPVDSYPRRLRKGADGYPDRPTVAEKISPLEFMRLVKPVEVMLLGVYHMDGGGSHVYETGTDDVLSERRQREIEKVVEGLVGWRPDVVAVEYPSEKQEELDEMFGDYLKGKVPEGMERSEIVQIGFRVAKRLGHGRLLAVDCFPGFEWKGLTEEKLLDFMNFVPPDLVGYVRENIEKIRRGIRERSVGEYLMILNEGEISKFNDAVMLSSAIVYSDGHTAYGVVAGWFLRNLCIVRNLYSSLSEGTEKVLLMYGSGHVPLLKYILSTSPLFRYVSPIPYLQRAIG